MRALLLLLSSCGLFDPPEKTPAPAPTPPDDMEEMADKKDVHMPGPAKLDPIDWVAAFERQKLPPEAVTADVQGAAKVSGVPVLLPSESDLLDDVRIFSGEGWYSATFGDDAHQVMVRGTRLSRSVDLPEADKSRMGAGDEVRVTTTEGIVTASFSLYGAAYNLEIECTKSADYCTEATALEYVEKLGIAGKKP